MSERICIRPGLSGQPTDPLFLFLLIFPAIIFPFSESDTLVYLIPKQAFIIVWLGYSLLYVVRRRIRVEFFRTDLLVITMLLLVFLSDSINSRSILTSDTRLNSGISYIIYFSIYTICRSLWAAEYRPRFFEKWHIFALLPLTLGLLQYVATLLSFPYPRTSTFGNDGSFSSFMMIALLLCAAATASSWKNLFNHRAVTLVLLSTLVGLINNRASLIALLVSLLYLLFTSSRAAKTMRIVNAFLILLGLTVAAILPHPAAYASEKNSDSGRFVLWRIAGKAIKDHPLLGLGTSGYDKAFYQHADWQNSADVREFILSQVERQSGFNYRIENDEGTIYIVEHASFKSIDLNIRYPLRSSKAHNEYLDLAVQYGVLMPVLWLAWIIIILMRARGSTEGSVVAPAILAILLFNIFWMNSITVVPILFLLLGILSAATSSRTGRDIQGQSGPTGTDSGACGSELPSLSRPG